ncbi:MAG: SAM-dependent methyltransferase, partial [Dichotomicrobium sp.]
SALALHFANDLPGTLVQIRRALKPDGLFIAALLGGSTLQELRASFVTAETEVTGGAAPRVAPMADIRDFGGLLQRAGFNLPVSDTDVVQVSYETPFALMSELRGMGAANALSERSDRPLRRDVLGRAAEIYAERYPAEGGRVTATFEIVTLTGWAPHESQQKPLRPGAASTRLADALGTQEHSAGDKADPGSARNSE